jgi:hypothetical protein
MKYTGRAKREGETLMPLRLCSILGTLLLALAFATPVLAQETQATDKSETRAKKKRKAKAKAKAAKADSAVTADATDAIDKSETVDKPNDSSAAQSKRSKRKGKKSKQDEEEEKSETEASATAAEASVAAEPAPEPDTWESPPAEEEKPPAAAVKPVEKPAGDGMPFSAGLLVGWAFETDRRSMGFSADPYGLGAGIRGGYSVPDLNLYAGLYFMYYLGSAVTGDSQYVNNATITTNANYMQFGAEIGYDWWVASVIIRPSMQLGAALVFTDVPNVQSPISDFVFAPGFTVVHPWDDYFLGGDFRLNKVTGDGTSSILLAVTAGMRF